jgi:hypothetical protein
LPAPSGSCSAQTRHFFRALEPIGVRHTGERAAGGGGRRAGLPACFVGQFRPVVPRLKPRLDRASLVLRSE